MSVLLQINSCANWGSTGKIAEQINQMAALHGWNTYFAYGRGCNPSKSKLIHIGNRLSQAIALFEARLFDNEGLANRWATRRLIEKIKVIRPDIIHLHNLHGYYINYKILFDYLNSTNIPIIWTLHDCWTFTGHCGHFVGAKCEKWKVKCVDCPLKKDYPSSVWLDRSQRNYELKKRQFTLNRNLHFVAVSQWLANLIRQSYFKNTDVRVINNGIDLNVFKPVDSISNGNFMILGVSSVWTGSKGLYDFYKLRKMLDRDCYEIILVGLSEEQIKVLPDGIKGIARTNSVEELVHFYSSANVFVNLTYGDTFPTTNLEALACGTPVLTYRTGGSIEAVTTETGWVVNQGDVESVSKILADWLKTCESPTARVEMRLRCRERAERFFNKEDRFAEYISLYNELLLAE